MRVYCDKKERKLEAVLDKQANAPAAEGKASIPLTQSHHYLYNFFSENKKYQPRLIKCVLELVPHLEFPIAVQSWVNIYRNGEGIKWHTHGGKNGYSYSANIFLGGHTTPGIYYSYTIGITIHGYQALDKSLVQGVAANNEYQETIFLNDHH